MQHNRPDKEMRGKPGGYSPRQHARLASVFQALPPSPVMSVDNVTPQQATLLGSAEPQFSPPQREPRFLSKGAMPILGTLTKDFVNFSLILVFYICCWSVGSAAFMLDNMFNTRLFEYFIRFIEYLDTCGL